MREIYGEVSCQAVIWSQVWFEKLLTIGVGGSLEVDVRAGNSSETSEVYQWAMGNFASETQQAMADKGFK